jgi:hypothetical protein
MEHMFKRFLILTAVITGFGISAADHASSVAPQFRIRSQGTNALRRLVGVWDKMNLYDTDSMNGFFSITPEYTRSFNPDRITECLFGIGEDCNSDCGASMLIQGPDVENRNASALYAPYFGLPSDYSSVVTFKPVIQNFLVDMFGYVGFDSCYEGLYAWIQFPITWTKWDLGFCERILNAGEENVPAGYISPEEINRDALHPSFAAYARGAQLDPFVQGDITVNFDALKCAKICNSSESETAVSEVRFAMGYNFLLCEDYHFGLNLQASAPTGNSVCNNFLFSPQNGNGKHWELGVGIDAHAILWRCEEEDSHFGFYLDANITHMFKHNEKRCFDLCGKPLSRYMTAARMNTANAADGTELHEVGDFASVPANVYSNQLSPLANITSFNVDVSVSVNADVVAMFNYTCGNWSWDLGYNFWGRSCEKIELDCKCPQTFTENTWVLQGDASQYGCENNVGANPHALSASNSAATIRGGSSNFAANANVDNAKLAAFGNPEVALRACSDNTVAINTSIQPVYIKASDINFAKNQGISNKFFTHFGYNWECECWNPFLGIGVEAEFAQHNNNDCKESCATSCKDDCDNGLPGDCVRCGLSQWGIWVKGGVAFN